MKKARLWFAHIVQDYYEDVGMEKSPIEIRGLLYRHLLQHPNRLNNLDELARIFIEIWRNPIHVILRNLCMKLYYGDVIQNRAGIHVSKYFTITYCVF